MANRLSGFAALPHYSVEESPGEGMDWMGVKSEPIGFKFEPLGFQSKRLKLAKKG
ncbi:MAG: hypothetical protein HY867_00960 [Chloroflexi bacterium]|nr:hypothetical protein [Chloroflexota bacterium]